MLSKRPTQLLPVVCLAMLPVVSEALQCHEFIGGQTRGRVELSSNAQAFKFSLPGTFTNDSRHALNVKQITSSLTTCSVLHKKR